MAECTPCEHIWRSEKDRDESGEWTVYICRECGIETEQPELYEAEDETESQSLGKTTTKMG